MGEGSGFAPARRPTGTRERGHPARSVRVIAARKAGRMPALPDIFKAPKDLHLLVFKDKLQILRAVCA